MQFLWKYIDDLMGKGLEPGVMAELMFYATANLVPMALPLAVLLSSIMAFGSLAENNELTSMKSGGMSLLRIMFPAGVFVFLLSIGAFFFSNYTWPAANLKLRVLISDITRKKPAMAIKEGVFYNDIDGYSIRVMDKEDNEFFRDVLIIDQRLGSGAARREIVAERAWMRASSDKQFLLVDLYNGVIDEELDRRRFKDSKRPYQQTTFQHVALKIKLMNFNLERTDLSQYQESYEMLSMSQLNAAIDSLERQIDSLHASRSEQLLNTFYIERDTLLTPLEEIPASAQLAMKNETRNQVLQVALSNIRRKKELIHGRTDMMLEDLFVQMIRFHKIAWHRKLTLSYACLLLFFIGAPLGAIIRKGGFGLPVVFSIVLFITYYMVSVSGEKMSKTAVMSPTEGMWLSAFVLTPLALFLSIQAMNDSRVMELDTYKRMFASLYRLPLRKRK